MTFTYTKAVFSLSPKEKHKIIMQRRLESSRIAKNAMSLFSKFLSPVPLDVVERLGVIQTLDFIQIAWRHKKSSWFGIPYIYKYSKSEREWIDKVIKQARYIRSMNTPDKVESLITSYENLERYMEELKDIDPEIETMPMERFLRYMAKLNDPFRH